MPVRERWTKAQAIVLLRLMLVFATSYLLLAHDESLVSGAATFWLILGALASNVPLLWLRRSLTESPKFGACLVVADTVWITAILLHSGYLDVDFYVVYLFVLFLAAIIDSITVISLGTVLVSLGYLATVFADQGAAAALSSQTLVRLPFFFAFAAVYGFLADRVQQERQTSLRLLNMAHRDALTKLPNRRILEERLERAISRASRGGSRIALLMFDLDRFKHVNDTHGHAVGDRLLIEIADRLRNNIRRVDALGRFLGGEFDTPSRLGGDEFAVVLTEVGDLQDVANVAHRLCALISAPFQIEGLEIATTTSVGIATLADGRAKGGSGSQSRSVELLKHQLLVRADRALYDAKRAGRNAVRFHDAEMDREIDLRMKLGQELRGVLSRSELSLEFQPMVDLERLSITGAEALLRWQHPTRGFVTPAEFVPIAESTGQIKEIGEWALEAACRAARSWMATDSVGIPVAVNLSAVQFRDPEFPETVVRTLEQVGLPPHLLELELTERVLLEATSDLRESLRRLHDEVGLGISLDNFGRGFSSLENLCRLPIDKLKVDRLFVNFLDEDPNGMAIVRAIVGLGKNLGKVVVAEGVETESQLEILRAEGCEQAQGYWFSRPLSSSSLHELLVDGRGLIRSRRAARSLSDSH